MAMYKEHESKTVKLNERPILATPEDLTVELGTIVAFIKKTQGVIEKAEAYRLAGRARFDADVIKSARAVQARFDVLKSVIDRYQTAVTQRNSKEN